ncbi:CDP-diacylglycerol--glycerol-3-phosphate 3-phosphatidyltransferase [Anaeropeptidivorans aminofermentans]|uniref:CDP-diacylglycerol--glycerol-3-phosphate 3-phosphatidyltransferase n=1 Tax=Anaeropeptidivorans aminofermentans TaxID=2934315 RepID=UPI0020243EE3|nr:CDP-diacylglycerol--glycerol-3-phosphate 3-phosphatidyltransferase [Anaeropeptidivorans aminofermentans]
MNLPNKLTVLRVCLIPVFLFFLLASPMGEPISRYVALSIFIIASSTDALDGYIARKYNLITNFGKFMDPLADKLLVCSAMIAMIEMGDIPSLAVIVIIAREFIITGFRLVASDEGIVIAASMWGKIKTITQMIMVIYLLLGLKGDLALSIGNILIMASVFFTVLSAVDYIYKNKAVLK